MRLRKLMHFIIVGIVFFIALALIINFWFAPAAQVLLDESKKQVDDITVKLISLDLPIRVIDNIQTQITNDVNNLNNENLIEAFKRNAVIISEINASTAIMLVKLSVNLSNINEMSLDRHQERLIAINTELNQISRNLDTSIKTIKNASLSSTDIDQLKGMNNQLNENVDRLQSQYNDLRNDVLNDFSFVLNSIFVVMIITLVLLTAFLVKYITIDQNFILKSFEAMQNKRYDFQELPKARPLFIEDAIIYKRIRDIFDEEGFTHRVKQIILDAYHIDELIERLYNEFEKNLNVDRVGVAFVDYSNQKFIAEIGKSKCAELKIGPGFEVGFDDTSLTEILKSKASVISHDLEANLNRKPYSPSLLLITAEGMKSNLIVPLFMGEVVFGMLFLSSIHKGYFTEYHKYLAEKLVGEISGYLNRAYFTKVILARITNSFAELVDNKDNETGDHINRMVAYSVALASGLMEKNIPGYEVTPKFVLEIERNASSHDIGKVAIPDAILKKPGKLTPDEWVIMKTHTEVGADIFKTLREGLQVFEADFYRFAEEIARHHHERWDGTGYPDGLSGTDIPLSARIVAIGDVFDALTSKRHYKDPFGFENSIQIIKESAGTHLDPVLVEVFLDNMDAMRAINKRGY